MDLWIADTEALELDRHLEQLLPLLPGFERERALRFRKREDRLRCAVGRVMIRALAAKRLGRADAALLVSEYGKPYFAQEDAPHFSLSHSGSLVVLASAGTPLGVDVEVCRQMEWRDFSSLFSGEERAMLESAEFPLACFYRIWTVREAFSKAVGLGLSLFEAAGAEINYRAAAASFQGEEYRFRTWEYPGYTVSLCAHRAEAEPYWLTAADWDLLEGSLL
ncbi:MAG: 4'-phosphopantetheinyl transferase superfamily protein [Oscillospiraceae bacterium]|nr:4'-phosphopantetheinyl transferase superfamily protein [Oscillospiraceae bacterium]